MSTFFAVGKAGIAALGGQSTETGKEKKHVFSWLLSSWPSHSNALQRPQGENGGSSCGENTGQEDWAGKVFHRTRETQSHKHGSLPSHVEEREATGRSHVTHVHTVVPWHVGPLKVISGTLIFLSNTSLPKRKTHACKPWVGTSQEHTVSWRADCFFLLICEYWLLSVLFFPQMSSECYSSTPKTPVSTYVGSFVSSVFLRPVRPGHARWASSFVSVLARWLGCGERLAAKGEECTVGHACSQLQVKKTWRPRLKQR